MSYGETTAPSLERTVALVVDAAYAVHRKLGPGLLESVYELCLIREITKRGLKVERQVRVPIVYDGEPLDAELRLDLLVAGHLVVEIKAVEQLTPLHSAQLLTYLKLTNHQLGLLINFNVVLIKDGIKRVIFTH